MMQPPSNQGQLPMGGSEHQVLRVQQHSSPCQVAQLLKDGERGAPLQ